MSPTTRASINGVSCDGFLERRHGRYASVLLLDLRAATTMQQKWDAEEPLIYTGPVRDGRSTCVVRVPVMIEQIRNDDGIARVVVSDNGPPLQE